MVKKKSFAQHLDLIIHCTHISIKSYHDYVARMNLVLQFQVKASLSSCTPTLYDIIAWPCLGINGRSCTTFLKSSLQESVATVIFIIKSLATQATLLTLYSSYLFFNYLNSYYIVISSF